MYVIVLFHTNTPWAEGAFIAVNLFFVLSGYLVTTVILKEIEKKGRLDLGRFYARRVRRLLPAALVAIAGISLLLVLVESVVRRVSVAGDAASSLLYYANWRFIAQSTDYFATDVDKSPFLHFWTLSIEEQFYVVFPLVLLLLLKVGGRRGLLWGMVALAALSLAAQFFWAARNPTHAYFGTDARAYQLLVGVILALVLAWYPVHLEARKARMLAVGGVGAFVVLCATALPLSQSVRGVLGTAACLAVVAGLMLAEDQPLGRLLARPIPVYLGQISYATYLWHWPAILVLQQVLDVGSVELAVLASVIATAMAAASAELVELPVRRAPRLDGYRWPVVATGLATSVAMAVLLVPAVLSWERQPALVTAGSGAAAAVPEPARSTSATVPRDVDWDRVRNDKGREHTCPPDDPDACIVHEGSGPHVLLVGDSHGAMLGDMWLDLARKHDFTLSMNVVLGCPWQENLQNVQSPSKRQRLCTESRLGWYDEALPKLKPDVVVLVGYPREDERKWGDLVEQRDGAGEDLDTATLRSTRKTLEKIDRGAGRVLAVQSVVVPGSRGDDPNECVTSTDDVAQCGVPVPVEAARTDGYLQTAATEKKSVYALNLTPAFCPDAPVCQPVVDDEIVFRDHLHLTPRYAAKRADQAWKLIRRSGVLDGLGRG
jgi:peptidoglycan/LPS O-acetylase OafA/YrhL